MRYLTVVLLICLSITTYSQKSSTPNFTLPDLKGNNYQLSENFGKGPILINFWATWCIPCKVEMKALKKIYKKYKDDGLQILSITIDDPKTVGKVKSEVRAKKYPFTILLDTNSEVFQLFKGTNPPLTVLIDSSGTTIFTHSGYRKGDEKELDKKIASLLKKEK